MSSWLKQPRTIGWHWVYDPIDQSLKPEEIKWNKYSGFLFTSGRFPQATTSRQYCGLRFAKIKTPRPPK